MHKAVQEVKEKHVYQKVLMEKINIEKGSSTGGDKESESVDVGIKEKGNKRKAIVTYTRQIPVIILSFRSFLAASRDIWPMRRCNASRVSRSSATLATASSCSTL